jgi:hypothetical protein
MYFVGRKKPVFIYIVNRREKECVGTYKSRLQAGKE